jgi:hypothetical protein
MKGMNQKQKKNLILFIIFGAISFSGLLVTEYWDSYFSGFDGLGRSAFLIVIVIIPATALSISFFVLFLKSLYQGRRSKKSL